MSSLIDVRGLACPKPVIEVKKAIESRTGEFKVITNSAESKENIVRFLNSQNISADVEDSGGEFVITFKTEEKLTLKEEKIQYSCSMDMKYSRNIIVSKNRLGDGDEKLGEILIRSFFHTLTELDAKPEKLFFVNSGVFLTVENSLVLDELKKLSDEGVKIFSCGTCLDYYKIKDKLSVGEIGNMYLLLEILMDNGFFI